MTQHNDQAEQEQSEKSNSPKRYAGIALAFALVLGIGIALYFNGDGGIAGDEATAQQGAPISALSGENAGAPGELATPVSGPQRNILAFGDSLFAGYNVAENQSYPAQLEQNLRARGINAKVANAGVSGDTSAAGLQRLAFTLDAQSRQPDLVIVELGGNDLLRGVSPEQTRANLDAILKELSSRGIDVLLMGMRAPPNLGPDFQRQFDAIYPDLARKYDASLVPFLLASIYDKPQLIQSDRIHPTAQGITAMVDATAGDVVKALPKGKADSGEGAS